MSAGVALVLSILYAVNGMLVTRQLQSGIVHFPKDNARPFTTDSSKSSPLTQKSGDRSISLSPFRGQKEKRDSISALNQGTKSAQKIEDDLSKKKFNIQSPETPTFQHLDSELKQISENSSMNRQLSTEKEKIFKRRVTSWFTDVGDTKKDVPTTMESTFTQASDPLKDDLDAREQYIKSKQYRDFMDPIPSKQRPSISKFTEDSVQKFTESQPDPSEVFEINSTLQKPKLSVTQLIEQNYKPTTTPYTRKPMPGDRKSQTSDQYQIPVNNYFENSQNSQISKSSSSNSELNQFLNRSKLYQERAIDVGSYIAGSVVIDDSLKKQKSIETLTRMDPEATPKLGRQNITENTSIFENSIGGISNKSIQLDDEISTAFVSSKTIASGPDAGLNSSKTFASGYGANLNSSKTFASRHDEIPKSEKIFASGSRTGLNSRETFVSGPGISLTSEKTFASGPRTNLNSNETFVSGPGISLTSEKTFASGPGTAMTSNKTFASGPSTFPSTKQIPDTVSLPSRSLSSSTSDSPKSPERRDSPQESSAGSTVRIDDIDRRLLKSPLRDSSLMTTSTIVSLNSTNITNWTNNQNKKYSNPENRWDNSKKGFDVIIRSRNSPASRPQSVTLPTEFPSYSTPQTTLRIQSPSDYSQYSRHSPTQL